MDVKQLIELIQKNLPVELTDAQIDEVRTMLNDKPELHQPLTEKLTESNWPAANDFDELIEKMRDMAPEERKKRSLLPAAIIVLVIAAIVVAVATMAPKPKKTATRPTTQPKNKLAASRPSDASPATAPASRPADADQATTSPAPAETQPAKFAIPPATFPLKWRDYALAGSKYDSNWQANLSKFLSPEGNTKPPKFSRSSKYMVLNGSYKLGAVPGPGRILRFDVKTGRNFELEFDNDENKIRITIDPHSRIQMTSSVKKDATSKPVLLDSASDHYRWQNYRAYGVDIRHQDGRMMVCRGEVPLVSVAMPKPPTEGKLTCSSTTLNIAEARNAGPLKLPKTADDPSPIRKTNAAAFKWTLAPTDKKTEEVELILDNAKGTVSIENRIDHIHAKSTSEIPLDPSLGVELTLHVTEFHPSTVISLQSEMGTDSIGFEPHEDRFILHHQDRKKKAQSVALGQSIGKEFWVKVRLGGDLFAVWISPDSKRWWLKQASQSTNKADKITLGFELPTAKVKDQGPRRTTLGAVTVRKFDRFAKFADPKLTAKVSAALTDKLRGTYLRADIITALSAAADKNASQRQWNMACNTVLASRATHWGVRREALRDILLDAAEDAEKSDLPNILATIVELSETAWPVGDLGPIQHQAFEALGRRCADIGQFDFIQDVVNASYMSHIGRSKSLIVIPNLLRIHLQSLIARQRWEDVRREAMRATYHAGYSSSHEAMHILPFVAWALNEAQVRLAVKTDAKTIESLATWRHPLRVNDDRELLNTLGEFMFLLNDKHYEPACKAITARPLPDALVSMGDETDLLLSSRFRIRETIRKTPQLRDVLNRKYSEIGMIRLERARRQNDLAALESLAVQFYGTEAGFGAMGILADRDLSNGNFWGAAARYKLLSSETNYAKRDDAAAKFRLASAMLGKLEGKPAEKPVALPGGKFSPKEFEQMIARLVANRKSKRGDGPLANTPTGPEPAGRAAKLTYLTTIGGQPLSPSRPVLTRPAEFTFDSERMIVSFVDKLTAIDRKTGKTVWFNEPDRTQRGRRKRNRKGRDLVALASRPLQIGDKLFVKHAVPGRPLTCIDSKTGTLLWSRQYDTYVMSDPTLIGSLISVITASKEPALGLKLHRISPDTGESSQASQLVRIRDIWPAIGRPAVVGDAILFRAEGCLVNCSLQGSVRWAKRLPFVPIEAAPALHADTPLDDMIVRDGNIILSIPGGPYVMCVEVQSGKTIWSFMTQPGAQIPGVRAGSLIISETDRIVALDPDTGKIRWTTRNPGRFASVVPAAKDTLLSVCLTKPATSAETADSAPFKGRSVRWISAKTGRVVKEIPIEGDSSIYHALQITSDGKRIFGLSNYEPGKLPKVFVIDLQN